MTSKANKILNHLLNIILVCGGLYGVYLGYNLWIDRSMTFDVKAVKVTGNEYFTRDEILNMGEIGEKHSIWDVSLDEATGKITSHPFIDRVHITRKLPDILSVEVFEKKPVAMLNFERNVYYLDRVGMVMPNITGKSCDLPVISGKFEGGLMVGHEIDHPWIDEGLQFVELIHNQHPEIYRNVSEVVVGKEDGLLLLLRKRALPVYLGHENRNKKIHALEAVLKDLQNKKQLHLVSYINLKYTNQVVVGMGA